MTDPVKDEASIPVTFKGEKFVWLKGADGSGALAYPQHIDETGNVKPMFCMSDSYAHVMSDGAIMRYGSQIGTRDDLASELSSTHRGSE